MAQYTPDTPEQRTQEEIFRPLPQQVIEANVNPQQYEAAYRQADEDYLAYWEDAARELEWFRKWDSVLDESEAPFYRWFTGGKCNIVHNALDRHITTGNKNKLALIWEGETGDTRKLTYYELYRAVNKFANALHSLGIKKGDTVVLYLPPLPETMIATLAIAKIGAVHCMVFAGFSAKALRERINDAQAKLIITVDGFYRNGQVLNMKNIVDGAMLGGCDSVDSVVVIHRATVDVTMNEPTDLWYDALVRPEKSTCPTEKMDAEDPLFLLYSSGTTGKPKGIVHTHGGYMVGVHRSLNWIFDIKPTDIFWSTADVGWITGHSYGIYGPLVAGTTTILFEGHPLYPQPDRLWTIIEKYGVTIFYTAPTLIRMLMRFGCQYPKMHDLSSLRLLGTVGETINPEAWKWLYEHIGRSVCQIMDTWWQTESGSFMISPFPVSLLKPGSAVRALPGIEIDIYNEEGESVGAGESGLLVVKKPWPSMIRTLHNDPERYKATYWERFPGVFLAGDFAMRDEDGYIWIQGRADDVLNIAGHRIGTVELENALTSHRAVLEAAVIGLPDQIKGEVAKAFVVLQEDLDIEAEELSRDLKKHVRKEMGPVAVIKSFEIRESLPKNRSGKIMRRVLKAEEMGEDVGDLSTLAP